MSNKQPSSAIWWIVGILAIGLVFIITNASKAPSSPEKSPLSKTNREVALSCTTDMATKFHIHPNLKIMAYGQLQEIPADIGVNNICMHPLHTHDASGKIHVESPEKRDFTLGDFFAVWNKTFTKDQILDYKVDETHIIRETVNGKEVTTFENTILNDLDEIVIYYE